MTKTKTSETGTPEPAAEKPRKVATVLIAASFDIDEVCGPKEIEETVGNAVEALNSFGTVTSAKVTFPKMTISIKGD